MPPKKKSSQKISYKKNDIIAIHPRKGSKLKYELVLVIFFLYIDITLNLLS